MVGANAIFIAAGSAVHEAMLFAATGFLVLGAGDLLIDLIWIVLRFFAWRRGETLRVEALAAPARPGPLAIFTPAWDESDVIGTMLRRTLSVLDHPDYRIYVGCYPNDPATIDEVRRVGDPRVRLVVGTQPGPTTKAGCLNTLWAAMLADEAAQGRCFKGVVLHDAEDVVHRDELIVFGSVIETHDFIQLPVEPLIHPASRWVSGHYADEFAESHAKEMVVRGALGASLPSAGVGCIFSRDALGRIADAAGGAPFDPGTLTEDYELGLKLGKRRQAFVRIIGRDGTLVATREYFPLTVHEAVTQKSRWVTGISLAGWDRLGWSGGIVEHWMRLRDRQSLLAALLLFCGYVSFAFWAVLKVPELALSWTPQPVGETLALVLQLNLGLLAWRVAMRVGFVGHAYGWRQGLLSVPRILVGNWIAIGSCWRAVGRYRVIRGGGRLEWGKTAHSFPAEAAAE